MSYYESEEYEHDRKQFRKSRKKVQQTDRSKYYKMNESASKGLHRGRVLVITGEGTYVDYEGKQYLCSLKGLLKKEKSASKNLVAVGDWVWFSISSDNEGAIAQVEERTSFLSRTDVSGKKEQLIAVNIDQAIVSISVVEPPLKPFLVDRYLIAIEKGNLHPIIAINKIDLLDKASEEEKQLYRDFLASYEPLGYPILSLSANTGVGIEAFRSLLQNKTSVFSGQSGVGKSSLLNICFGLTLKVGELAQKTLKGSHTTTTAELLPLPGGGYCVDTPGIRSFSIWNLKKEDVMSHFREFNKFSPFCKFPDCTHLNEPECAVIQAIEEEKIPLLRYESYQILMNEALVGLDKTTWS